MAFDPNCTLPDERVAYVGAPNVRSTLGILWPSLATIIACTYTVLHLSVPEQRLGRDRGFKGDLQWTYRRLLTSVKWSCINILAPEFILTKAIADWVGAREELHLLYIAIPSTRKTWTMAHMLFADMGGFVVGYTTQSPEANVDIAGDEFKSTENGTEMVNESSIEETRLGYQRSEQGGWHDKFMPLTECQSSAVWHLRACSLRHAIQDGLLSSTLVTVDDILDRSKHDAFAKVLAIAQICYYIVEVLTRAIKRLPVSPMELGVTGFVACSSVTYAFSLQKPKGVSEAFKLGVYDGGAPIQISSLPWKRDTFFELDYPIDRSRVSHPSNLEISKRRVNELLTSWETIAAIPICVVFGAIHLAGWNLEFPIELVDRWLWRVAALTGTAIYPLYIGIILTLQRIDLGGDVYIPLGMVVTTIHAISRLIIIGEMVRCLFYLPPEAFIATWTSNVPHIG